MTEGHEHQVRAIKVLKRDLRREEQRKEEEERRKNAEAMMLPPPVPPPPIDTTSESSAAQGASNGDSASTRSSPIVGTLPGRRPSAISISSLHRPQFPLKLDLSSTALRITEEEAALYQKGPTSPVTLAPKSARPVGPHDLPPDFLMAFGNNPLPNDVGHGPSTIDLTLPDDMHLAPDQTGMSLGVGIGDSSEKPIELDLDSMDIEMAGMTDLFGDPTDSGDANDGHDGLFSPALGQGSGENPQATVGGDTIMSKVEENTLVDFQMDSNVNDGLFSDFTATAELGPELDAAGAASGTSDMPTANGGEAFDINSLDLSSLDPGFFGDAPDTEMNFSMDEMDAFLDMGSSTEEKKDETMGDPTGSQS